MCSVADLYSQSLDTRPPPFGYPSKPCRLVPGVGEVRYPSIPCRSVPGGGSGPGGFVSGLGGSRPGGCG